MQPSLPPRARPSPRTLAAALLLLAGCATLPPAPPEQAPAAHGVVHAESDAVAEQVAHDLDATWVALRDFVPGCRDVPVTVWVQRHLRRSPDDQPPAYLQAFAVPDHDLAVVREGDRERRHSLAHELFHVLHDETWGALPTYMEEGVADVVAQRLASGERSELEGLLGLLPCLPGVEAEVVVRAPDGSAVEQSQRLTLGGARLDAADVRALLERVEPSSALSGSQGFSSGYALGYCVARRILDRDGLLGLRALCAAAQARGLPRVPVAELLEAAELPADPAPWWPLLAEDLQPADVRAAAEFWATSLADSLRRMLPGPGAAAARVAAGDVELRIGPAQSSLVSVPGLADALR